MGRGRPPTRWGRGVPSRARQCRAYRRIAVRSKSGWVRRRTMGSGHRCRGPPTPRRRNRRTRERRRRHPDRRRRRDRRQCRTRTGPVARPARAQHGSRGPAPGPSPARRHGRRHGPRAVRRRCCAPARELATAAGRPRRLRRPAHRRPCRKGCRGSGCCPATSVPSRASRTRWRRAPAPLVGRVRSSPRAAGPVRAHHRRPDAHEVRRDRRPGRGCGSPSSRYK
jgi:hypothetical protein